MKIAHVIPALTSGGAERVVVDLANAGIEAGHEMTVIAAVPAAPELVVRRLRPEVKRVYVGNRSVRDSYLRLVPWLVRNRRWLFQQDIVHCHLTFGSLFGAVLQRMRSVLRSLGPAVVETYHAVGVAIPNLDRAVHARLMKGRDAIAFMAEDPYWRRYANARPAGAALTIPNGIAAPRRASEEAVASYRQHAGIPPWAKVIGTVSRLVPERRPQLLLLAFAEIARQLGPDVHMLIGGEGPERGALELMLRQLDIEEQVHMPGLVLDPAEPIGALDLFLTINVGPITGIAALEAVILGRPVIAVQLLDDYRMAPDDWIWSSSDPHAVAAEAVRLLKKDEAREALAKAQQAHAQVHHGVDRMADAYYALYREVLDKRSVNVGSGA